MMSWIYNNNSKYFNPVKMVSTSLLKTIRTDSFKKQVVNDCQNSMVVLHKLSKLLELKKNLEWQIYNKLNQKWVDELRLPHSRFG